MLAIQYYITVLDKLPYISHIIILFSLSKTDVK